MTTVEALCSDLRSLIKVTNSLYLSVEKEDYSSLSEMLDRRGQILDSQNRLADAWKISFVTESDRQQQVSRLRPLVEILERGHSPNQKTEKACHKDTKVQSFLFRIRFLGILFHNSVHDFVAILCFLFSGISNLEQLDKKIVTLFEKKKEELAEKLKQAQNQKRLRAYSR